MLYEEILLYHFPEFKENYTKKLAKKESVISHIIKNDNSKIVKIINFFYLWKLDKEDDDDDTDDVLDDLVT